MPTARPSISSGRAAASATATDLAADASLGTARAGRLGSLILTTRCRIGRVGLDAPCRHRGARSASPGRPLGRRARSAPVAQVPRHREHHPAFAEGVRHPALQGRPRRVREGPATRTCGARSTAASARMTRFKGKDKVKSWGDRQAKLPTQGDGGGGAQARRHHARNVDRQNALCRRPERRRWRGPGARRRKAAQASGGARMSAARARRNAAARQADGWHVNKELRLGG